MIIISNPFALACRHLLLKYTISTLQFVNIADNQDSYGCIWKFSRFQAVKKERLVNAFSKNVCQTIQQAPIGSRLTVCSAKLNKIFQSEPILSKRNSKKEFKEWALCLKLLKLLKFLKLPQGLSGLKFLKALKLLRRGAFRGWRGWL